MKFKHRPIRFFCHECGKEIWQDTTLDKTDMMVWELAPFVECADCLLRGISVCKPNDTDSQG